MKSQEKICPQCKTSFVPSRSDAVFCGPTCRWNAWREKKGKGVPKIPEPLSGIVKLERPDLSQSLRGIVDQTGKPLESKTSPVKQPEKGQETKNSLESVKIETDEYKAAFAKKEEADTLNKRVLALLHVCNENISNWEGELKKLENIRIPSSKRYRTWNVDIEALEEESLCETEIESLNREEKKTHAREKINESRKIKPNLEQWVLKANLDLTEANRKLENTPRYKPQVSPTHPLSNLIESVRAKKAQQDAEQSLPEPVQETTPGTDESEISTGDESEAYVPSSRFMSSQQLCEMDYKCLQFKGRWEELFGRPATVFHLAVHGKSGHGKSTFCMLMANYLAENFGQVLYISGEEGFSKTLRDKAINNKANSRNLTFADFHNSEEIKEHLENRFHFIFIDSLNNMNIDPARLKELRGLYPDSAFITISQSTKDGKLRGSNVIVHDSDIAVQVESGLAMTTKNRFKEIGMEFRMFPASGKSGSKPIEKPRNLM